MRLESIGVRGIAYDLLKNYLTNRTQSKNWKFSKWNTDYYNGRTTGNSIGSHSASCTHWQHIAQSKEFSAHVTCVLLDVHGYGFCEVIPGKDSLY